MDVSVHVNCLVFCPILNQIWIPGQTVKKKEERMKFKTVYPVGIALFHRDRRAVVMTLEVCSFGNFTA